MPRNLAEALRWPPLLNQSGTSISGALLRAAEAIEGNDGYAGTRRVIDISGDGPNNRGVPVTQARDYVASAGDRSERPALHGEKARVTGTTSPTSTSITRTA